MYESVNEFEAIVHGWRVRTWKLWRIAGFCIFARRGMLDNMPLRAPNLLQRRTGSIVCGWTGYHAETRAVSMAALIPGARHPRLYEGGPGVGASDRCLVRECPALAGVQVIHITCVSAGTCAIRRTHTNHAIRQHDLTQSTEIDLIDSFVHHKRGTCPSLYEQLYTNRGHDSLTTDWKSYTCRGLM